MITEQILEKIKQERGESALRDGKQLIGLFVDFARGQLKPQANVLRVFVDCQGNTRILNLRSVPQQEQQVRYHHLVQEMVNNHCMQESAVLEVCNAFWRVVNGTLPPVFSSCSEPEKVSVLSQSVSEPPEPALDAEQMYQQGQACYQSGDYPEAAKWYRKAAEQGHMQAQLELGFAYENGMGVKQNSIEAVNWYRKAAEQGCAAAQDRMAYCYGKGSGVEKNLKKAVSWCKKAYRQDFPGSGRRLRQLEEKLSEERPELYPKLSSDEFGILNGKLVKYNGSAANVVIPEGVKQIKARAFENNRKIRSVILPDKLIGIGAAAFSGCTMLRQVVIPGSVSVVNLDCFAGCRRLNKLVLQPGVQKIIFGGGIAQLYALRIVIPDTVTSITWSNISDADRAIRMKHPKKIIASEKWTENFQQLLTDNPDFSVQSQLGMGGWLATAVQRIEKMDKKVRRPFLSGLFSITLLPISMIQVLQVGDSEALVICLILTAYGLLTLTRLSRVWRNSWRFPVRGFFMNFIEELLRTMLGMFDIAGMVALPASGMAIWQDGNEVGFLTALAMIILGAGISFSSYFNFFWHWERVKYLEEIAANKKAANNIGR